MDWVRLVGPGAWLSHFVSLLEKRLGAAETSRSGKFNLSECWKFACGAAVHGGGRDDYAVVELPARAIGALGREEFVWVVGEVLRCGAHFTRLDVAVDFREGTGRGLIDAMRKACEEGCLVGARVFRDVYEGTKGKGMTGRTLYLGKRGKEGSGRMARCYDKGLEAGECEAGEWVRYEVEFTGDCAQRFGMELWLDGVKAEALWAGVFGAFDFRENTGDKHVDRRPRLGFWAAILGAVRTTCWRALRISATAEAWCEWARKAWARQVTTMAERIGTDVGSVVGWLLRGVDHVECPLGVAREVGEWVAQSLAGGNTAGSLDRGIVVV